MARVTLNYWAGARSAAGVESDDVEASDLDEALARIRSVRPGQRFSDVLAMSSLMLDGRVVGADERRRPLLEDVQIEVLPPFAGGSHMVDLRITM